MSNRKSPFRRGRWNPIPLNRGHQIGPSTYALSRSEYAAELNRLRRAGWQQWEIDQVLERPQTDP